MDNTMNLSPNESPKLEKASDTTAMTQNEDDQLLARLGYKQELYRGFNAFMNFSFNFTAVAVISSISVLFSYGLITGGPVVMFWGWIIGSFFSNLVGMSMAEICSSYPSAGSVYHWAGMLSNAEWAPFASYITGWFNFLGNAAGDASFAFGFGQIFTAAIFVGSNGDIDPPVGYQVLVAIIASGLWAIKNLMRIDRQGWFNNASAIYQVLSTIVIITAILVASPSLSTGEFVFFTWNNETGMPNTGYVCCIGLLMALFSFSGYEGGAHMAEETRNATTAAPKGIIRCCLATAFTGLLYIVGLLFACQNEIDDYVSGTSSFTVANIFMAAFTDANGNYNMHGALAMTALLLINLFFAGFSSMTVTTRIGFAMARDGAFPGSKYIYKVTEENKSPSRVILLVFFIDVLLCLLPLGSTSAFTAITSITAIGYQISYAIPIFLRLTVARNTFKKSDLNLGKFSIVIGWIAVVWLSVTSTFFIWPTAFDDGLVVTATNFNYTCVVVGGVLVLAMSYWFLWARRFFKGPKRSENDQSPVKEDEAIKLKKVESDRL